MTKSELYLTLKADDVRFGNYKPNIKDYILRNEVWYIYHYIRYLRYVDYYRKKGGVYFLLYIYYFIKYKRLSFKLHFTIYPGTIGPGFRIYHVGGFTHVGRNVRIGKNCTMLPGVVFGNKTENEDIGFVSVGDNCYIGLNAKILGPVQIGNNVVIGANSVVTKSIPDNVVVAGCPARIIKYRK